MVLRTHTCVHCRADFQTVELGIDQPKPLVETLMAWAAGRGLRPEALTLAELATMMAAGNHQQDGQHDQSGNGVES